MGSKAEDTRVAVVPCPGYDDELVYTNVKEAIDRLGGIGKFVSPGQRVLLKVNLLTPSEPEKSIVTHPSVVAAMARLVAEAGGTAIIGDSPGGPYSRGRLEQCYRKGGLYEVAEKTGAILNFNTESFQASHPEGRLMKRLDLIELLNQVDVVIGLCKLKTHSFLTFTGATKILFGVVPGATKYGYHAKLKTPQEFADMLLDILTYVKPAFMLMDAVVAMEGDGPAAGHSRPLGLLLASENAVALDVAATQIVGMTPSAVPTIRAAMDRQLTTGNPEDLEIIGPPLADVSVHDFQMPPKGPDVNRIPPFIRNILVNQLVIRPQPMATKCTGCATCSRNCPVDAIVIKEKKAIIDQSKCIRCYCCHELCPETAVELRRSWLVNTLQRIKLTIGR